MAATVSEIGAFANRTIEADSFGIVAKTAPRKESGSDKLIGERIRRAYLKFIGQSPVVVWRLVPQPAE